MIKENLLSAHDLAQELNTGIATVKFLAKRFKNYLPCQKLDGRLLYSKDALMTLIAIQEKIEMGFLPSDIEEELKQSGANLTDSLASSFDTSLENGDIRMSSDGLALLKSLFSDIGEQQKRIATAHEKRAQAEERKAVAIEKRAIAEEKKAEAMNNIASALQEMNQIRSTDSTAQQIAHQAAKAIGTEEISDEEWSKIDGFDDIDPLSDVSDTEESEIIPEEDPDDLEMDDIDEMNADLSSLLEEDNLLEEIPPTAILSESDDINFEEEIDSELSDPLSDLDHDIDLEDLSDLIEEVEDDTIQNDDLSLLIDSQKEGSTLQAPELPLDDLNLLVDSTEHKSGNDNLDDLSALLEPGLEIKESASDLELDDLSKLIDIQEELDDLSLLISPPGLNDDLPPQANDLDDLSLLISEDASGDSNPEATPEIKIDVSPEDGVEVYKSAVMKVIFELKTEGLSAEETTARLNSNQVKTLSGKPDWSLKAISQIYKFIDAAK